MGPLKCVERWRGPGSGSRSRWSSLLPGRVALLGLIAAPLLAMTASAETAAVSVELNKLEPLDKGCRAYFVVTNDSPAHYQTLKLDLVLFQPDGVIGRRFAIDLAPLKPSKRAVKLFDLDDVTCDRVGSLLINDALDCKTDAGPLADCLATIAVKSLTSVQLTK